ncbi:MAG TPA: PEP-CTERM sorting domain-containing protein [Lacipirellulaceae bacterium]|nr:PEP-CTERM sorting domain-containing protein [Lacipirellulaceae bacterium]
MSVPAIITANPNNDNQLGGGSDDNNIVIPLKRFDANGYIDLLFTTSPSQGTTEYKVTEFVDNNTGLNWSKYTMQLGFGTGSGFKQASPSDIIDFDAPNYDTPPTSTGLPSVSTNPTVLVFSGGTQGTGAQTYTFRLDVPDLLDGGTQFTIRQQPTAIPEPGTFALAALAALGFCVRRRG